MDVTGKSTIHSDSSATHGFCQKIGVGRMKHIHHRCMQQKVRDGEMKISLVDTQMNVAAIGTKYLGGQRMVELLRLLPMRIAALAAMASGANAENMTAAQAAFAHWAKPQRWRRWSRDLDGMRRPERKHTGNVAQSPGPGDQGVATERHVKYQRDLARKRGTRVSAVSKLNCLLPVTKWTRT
eukprot:780594-Amphidinium_carterae.3